MNSLIYNLSIAFDALKANQMRSVLTALGIIFGIAAVITMVSIGNGAQQKVLEQIKLVGANNIMIHTLDSKEKEEEEKTVAEGSGASDETVKKQNFSMGLSMRDMRTLKANLPHVDHVIPEVNYETDVVANGRRRKSNLIGVTEDYQSVYQINTIEGYFFKANHVKLSKPVCVIGSKLASRLFPETAPLGKWLKCNGVQLKIIGIVSGTNSGDESLKDFGVNNYEEEIYAPISTVLLKFKNRGTINSSKLSRRYRSDENINQLDKITIQVSDTRYSTSIAEIAQKHLLKKHRNSKDFKVVVPQKLLNQQKETDQIFNYLLGAIASISLIVGGIGIMNIMLASVMERIKEIGLRLAVGAKKSDIRQQFIFEALLISITGGIIGVLLGILLSRLVSWMMEMPITISYTSIVLSFVVSAGVGIIFGYMPAKKAADQDPVKSLRHE